MQLAAQLKTFVDRADVQAALEKSGMRLLGRLGAFIRRRAQTSMRKRKKPSPPGKPPSVHSGQLRRFIFFGAEVAGGVPTLVVGPTLFGRRQSPVTPELHEAGGTRHLPARTATFKQTPGRDGRGRYKAAGVRTVRLPAEGVSYPARPTMGPARDAETSGGKLAAQLKDYIRP